MSGTVAGAVRQSVALLRRVLIESVILPGGPALAAAGQGEAGQLCDRAGVTPAGQRARVQEHLRRFRLYGLVMLGFQGLITVSLLVIFFRTLQFFVWPSLRILLQSYINTDLFALATFTLLWVVLYLFFAKITGNLAAVVVNGYYAESICVVALLHLVIDLDKAEALTPARKKRLLRRINHLARTTRLLYTLYFKYNERNREWLARHFAEMEAYIMERGRWLIAAQSGTPAALRRDFRGLLPIYISGDYGEFRWANLVTGGGGEGVSVGQRLVSGLPRFFGIVLPLTLMGLYLWRPDLLPFINLSPDVVTLIFLAWLLLSIDALLNLGVVAGLANLAKGLKELK